jgi:hypothetical protein
MGGVGRAGHAAKAEVGALQETGEQAKIRGKSCAGDFSH